MQEALISKDLAFKLILPSRLFVLPPGFQCCGTVKSVYLLVHTLICCTNIVSLMTEQSKHKGKHY